VAFDVPGLVKRNGDQANIYVRPHELHIERHVNGTPAIAAAVARINPAGSLARVALSTPEGRDIQVDLPLDRLEELRLQPGETVYVSAKRARVFTPDYVI
jgi:sulfate transport system ATP-binding protein